MRPLVPGEVAIDEAADSIADEVEAALHFLMHGGEHPPTPSIEAVRAMVEHAEAEGHKPDADGYYRLTGPAGHSLSFRNHDERDERSLNGKVVNKPRVKPPSRRARVGFRLRMNPLAHAVKTQVVSDMARNAGEGECELQW